MATYTTNLNLKKPAQSDKIRIADINNNMDDIDAAFGAIGNDSVATQIGNIQGALAIVAVGDSHAAVTAGQFVYVRSHETLDAGLYVASANIAENGALSLSNLTADSSGGLNALNSNLSDKLDASVFNNVYQNRGFFKVLSRIATESLDDDSVVGEGYAYVVTSDNGNVTFGYRGNSVYGVQLQISYWSSKVARVRFRSNSSTWGSWTNL